MMRRLRLVEPAAAPADAPQPEEQAEHRIRNRDKHALVTCSQHRSCGSAE